MSFEKKTGYRRRYKRNYRKKFNKSVSVNERKVINAMITKRLATAPEKKIINQGWNGTGISNTGSRIRMTTLAQGVGAEQRVGNEITLQSLFYRICLTLADTTNIIRYCIIQILEDDQPLALSPPYGTFFQFSTGGDPTNTKELMSPLIITDRNYQFKMLLDKHVVLNAENPQVVIEGTIKKFARKNITYDSTGYGEGHIYFCYWSDSLAVSHPTVDGYCRIRYTDM